MPDFAPLPETSAPRPRTARRKLYDRRCPECGQTFKAGRDSRFCCDAHKNRFHNRNAKRGKVAIPLMLAWRGQRGRSEIATYAFQQLCALADQWNRDDAAAGRLPAWDYIAPKMRQGWRAVDLGAGD